MPHKMPHPCGAPGCPNTVNNGRYCDVHKQSVDEPRGTSARRGYGYKWQQLRRMFLREHPLCADPFSRHGGVPPLATDVDHITRKRDGGTDDPSNLQGLCHSCHSMKTRAEMGVGGDKSLGVDDPRPHGDLSRAPAKLRFPQK